MEAGKPDAEKVAATTVPRIPNCPSVVRVANAARRRRRRRGGEGRGTTRDSTLKRVASKSSVRLTVRQRERI